MTWLIIVGTFLLVALIVYALTGGADFGGGVWDLFATGPRANRQRAAIERAIGPIWEANHVWLIIVVVLLFVAFAEAFYVIMVALQIPLFLLLLGIVLRGSSFIFRSYGVQTEMSLTLWSRIFAISSVFTPFALGVCLGGTLSGNILVEEPGIFGPENYIDSWWAPFPMALGAFILVLFSYLAAIYLAAEVVDSELKEDFRKRALIASVILGITALVCLLTAREGAPYVYEGLTQRGWSLGFQLITGGLAVGTLAALILRRYRWAQGLAITHVTVMIGGWAGAQLPYIVPESLTFGEAASEVSVLRPLGIALISGMVFLVPSFAYLYYIFKGPQPVASKES